MKVEEAATLAEIIRTPLIKHWSAADRPREKLVVNGPVSLTNAELIAILLRTGIHGRNVLDISRKILEMVNDDLNALAALSVRDLQTIPGIGKAKAIVIQAAMELGRRRREATTEKPTITTSYDAYILLHDDLSGLPHEEFWVMLLNRGSKLILKRRISSGGVSGTFVDPKIIFKLALDERTSSMILAHNHPSGNLNPSQSDLDLTRKLAAAGKLFDIQVVDHLILAGKNYCSFADSGLL